MASQDPIPPANPPAKPAPDGPPILNLKNIQGDILGGLPKKTETFYFFQITNPTNFRRDLRHLLPLIKSAEGVIEDRKKIDEHKRKVKRNPHQGLPPFIPLIGVNIAFSHQGFEKLKIPDDKLEGVSKTVPPRPGAYTLGQLKDSTVLDGLNDKPSSDDPSIPDWEEDFKKPIHGVIVITGESHRSVDETINRIEGIFDVKGVKPSISKVTSIRGDARPGDLSAHEHFGYLDGVSNPAIIGFDTNPPPGPEQIHPGVILLDHEGDPNKGQHDPWMADGSFLVFRYLFQKVPEFDDFVERNAARLVRPGLNKKQATELLGARLVGRWKSGAPLDITPFLDDPDLATDSERNNDFHFSTEINVQKLCPYAAHIRRTLPRGDLPNSKDAERFRIMRRGIQFGPEVTKQEKSTKTTLHGRGLLFACYQSVIENGFRFIQTRWSNNPNFPPGRNPASEIPGLDPIIGQAPPNEPELRKMTGVDPDDPLEELPFDGLWVVPRGGEYFFSPSISAIRDTIAI